jgi:hypothetical protein
LGTALQKADNILLFFHVVGCDGIIALPSAVLAANFVIKSFSYDAHKTQNRDF